MSYEMLFSPMNIGTMTVKNRIVMTAAEFSLGHPNGKPTEKLMNYYEERAKGGVGLIIPGICRVNDTLGAASYTQLGMSHDSNIEPMREFAERIHKHGAKLAIQLHHAGRQGYCLTLNTLPLINPIVGKFPKMLRPLMDKGTALMKLEEKGICLFPTQAPSKVEKAKEGGAKMRAMSKREIRKLIRDFIDAAERCKKAGVDAVELHGGHGYLIQQFLSPHTNRRTDEYGGSFENRLRFLSEIVQGIKERCGRDYPLIVRLTVDEMYEKVGRAGTGYTLETGKEIAKRLEELGVDAINVTSACYDAYNYWLEPTSFEPGWRKYLAKEIKSVVNIPVIAANVIRTPKQAERQLQEGWQDFMGSARAFICDPHWVKKAEEGREDEIRRCIGCLNCISSFMTNAVVGNSGECALNMSIAREKEYFNMDKDGAGREIVIVGAGPAGLTAAETMAMRGFKVRVYEKEEKAGGQLIIAAACNLKDKLYWAIEDLVTRVKKLGVEVKLGTALTAEEIIALNPYAVIVATGGIPIRPSSIPGLSGDNVSMAPEIIMGEKKIEGKSVVVAGSGMTGLETTEILNENGNRVTIIEMADELAPGTWFQLIDDELERIHKHETNILLNTKLVGVEDGRVIIEDSKNGRRSSLRADHLVLALGVSPADSLADELKKRGLDNVYRAGDAASAGTIADACHSAYDTAMTIK